MIIQGKAKILSLFSVIILLVAVLSACGSPAGTSPVAGRPNVPADRVDVVYFHREQRCYSCLYAETELRYTLETYFVDELASGKIVFQVISLEDTANAEIVRKYRASFSFLYMTSVIDGTEYIEPVTEIWQFIGDDSAFVQVVKDKVEARLRGTS